MNNMNLKDEKKIRKLCLEQLYNQFIDISYQLKVGLVEKFDMLSEKNSSVYWTNKIDHIICMGKMHSFVASKVVQFMFYHR